MTSVDIQPIESGGKYWIHVTMDGDELAPRGPFPDADAAAAVANQVAGICRGLNWLVKFSPAGSVPAAQRRREQRP